jgi:hypothetical protein
MSVYWSQWSPSELMSLQGVESTDFLDDEIELDPSLIYEQEPLDSLDLSPFDRDMLTYRDFM